MPLRFSLPFSFVFSVVFSFASLLLLCLALLTSLPSNAGAQNQVINSFETDADLRNARANNSRIETVPEHATEGKRALKVTFLPAEWPNVTFAPPAPWDWSHSGALALDVTNPSSEAVAFNVRVDDDVTANGIVHCRTGSGSVPAGKTVTFEMTFGPDPMSVGMRGLPAAPGAVPLGAQGSGSFNQAHIVAFQIFMHSPAAKRTLLVDNIRLTSGVVLDGIVDRFGQYTRADWPGKVHNEADLLGAKLAEEADLQAHPALADRDKFGGWSAGPKQKTTGFFRTEKVEGKWWLVDPEGNLFFSTGLNAMRDEIRTFVTGREKMFAWLPDQNDPLAKHYGKVGQIHSGPVKSGTDYSFYMANLERKYGPGYAQKFIDSALHRLPSWGFNTVANWSDERFADTHKIAYVATTGIGGSHATVKSGSDYWSPMHDPFDPKFADDVKQSLAGITARVKGDPWCVGYFVDNELSWAGNGENAALGLAIGALGADAGSPAKLALVSDLKAKYKDVATLNTAWGAGFANWAAFEGPVKLPATLTAACKADLSAFVHRFAKRYFQVIRDELKRQDPDHLYLGCRFAWHGEEAVQAAAEVCDVVSFNIYAPKLDRAQWASLTALNKPCIIGEFHFGALDRGMFHPGLVSTPSQQARAQMYVDYVASVLDHPAFVGCHWFQYIDEPLTGRTWDGENYNIGFLTTADTPYPEMVAAARTIHSILYKRRSEK